MVVSCPILRKLPHLDDCHYCPNYNYIAGICEHDDIPNQTVQVIEHILALRPSDQAQINHLEKRLNEHLDKSRKPFQKKTGYKGLVIE